MPWLEEPAFLVFVPVLLRLKAALLVDYRREFCQWGISVILGDYWGVRALPCLWLIAIPLPSLGIIRFR